MRSYFTRGTVLFSLSSFILLRASERLPLRSHPQQTVAIHRMPDVTDRTVNENQSRGRARR